MGIFDRIFGRKKEKKVKGKKYILVRKGAKGGYEKVLDLPRMMTPDELYPALTAGIYCVHVYEEGRSGFDSTEAFEVLGDEPAKGAVLPQRRSMFSGLKEVAEDFKGMKDDLGVFFETFGPMFGYGKGDGGERKTLLDEIREAKAQQEDLNRFFPLSDTQSQKIPVEGSIPAALVYAPTAIDQALDSVEKRLIRWGLVGEEATDLGRGREVIRMPEKPKKAVERKVEVEDLEVKEAKIEMPKKPEIKMPKKPEDEIRVVEVDEEEKTKEEEKKDVKRTKTKE